MRKQNDAIEIIEDTRVPGTEVILEKGDKISVRKPMMSEDAKEVVGMAVEDNNGDSYGSGLDAGDDIMRAAKRSREIVDIKEFARGVIESAEMYL